jgi:long-chain acyl-CoA synthetase
VLFIQPDLLAAIDGAVPPGVRVITVAHVPDEIAEYDAWLAAQAPYAGPPRTPRGHMAYTSGTTGRPKGVRRQPLDGRAAGALGAGDEGGAGHLPGVRSLLSAPLYHSAPSSFAQQSLLQGSTVRARREVRRRGHAGADRAPPHRHRLPGADHVRAPLAPAAGSALALRPLLAQLRRLDRIALRARHQERHDRLARPGDPRSLRVERNRLHHRDAPAGCGTQARQRRSRRRQAAIRILDDAGRELPAGEIGIIYAHQPAYSDFSYHGNDAARRAVERDGLVSVGDMGYLDEDGFLYVCDRASDMVISGGVNIYPAEIEHVLITLPGIIDCAVVGIPDEEFGESLAAQVVAEAGVTLDAEAIRQTLRERIAAYKVPRRIDIVDGLPRDDNGKVVKRRIRDAYWSDKARKI